MTSELDLLGRWQTHGSLETLTNASEHLSTWFTTSSLLARATIGASPETDTIETLADVDHNTHDLVIIVVLQCLSNCSKHDVKPEIVNGYTFAVLGGVRPLAPVLVLRVLPFWSNSLLEEMIVRFGG
jgi:hypothetical protein